MNIIVVGCGKIGTTIISSLVAEAHDVVAIDKDPEKIAEVTNIHDIIGVCGNGTDCDVLEEAEVGKADLLVAVTGSDEFNMLSCFLAKRMGAKQTIARIRNPEYNDKSLSFMKQQLGLSMAINPELLAAREMLNILKLPSAAKVETFSVRNFEVIEFNIKSDSALDGMKILDMRAKFKSNFLVCAVKRGDMAYIPDGNFVLKSGDRIGVTVLLSEISKMFKELGVSKHRTRNIMILGGGRTAYYLTKMLTSAGNSVTVIEKNKPLCDELCEAIPKAVVINGDGSKVDLLIEEGLHSVDAFVGLTGMDEQNILISSFAASQNVPKIIAKVNRDELIPLAEQWGLDCVISPRKIIADVLVRYARALQNSEGSSMETLYKLMDDKVEALEFRVKPDFEALQKTFKELQLKKNILVAAIVRDRKVIIPSGDDMLLAYDRVIIFAANQRINKLSDILK